MTRMRRRRHRERREKLLDRREEDLLDLRLCDLDLAIEGTPLERRIGRLHGELAARGLEFRPHFWLAEDWFSPDAIPGVAIPFYLAHPRLARLEKKMMRELIGGTEDAFMRILRHETGHAFDTAYRLHRRKGWRDLFGKSSQPYPRNYQPRPYSRSYVVHLELWYAQSHPFEDFAETFAVWLRPRSPWRKQYRGWPAMRKLEYVEETMAEIGAAKPLVRSRARSERLETVKTTLREYYIEKRDRFGLDLTAVYDRELRRMFADPALEPEAPSATALLDRQRRELRRLVSVGTGEYQYTVDQVLNEMIDRCRALDLRVDRDENEVVRDVLVTLTAQIMNYLREGHHRVVL